MTTVLDINYCKQHLTHKQHYFRQLYGPTLEYIEQYNPTCFNYNHLNIWKTHFRTHKVCNKKWGSNANFPSIIGYEPDIDKICNVHNVRQIDISCLSNRLNVLYIQDWNICKNIEWLYCVSIGHACSYANNTCNKTFILATPVNKTILKQGPDINDIYHIEICILSLICNNAPSLYDTTKFTCEVNVNKLYQLLIKFNNM